MIKVICTNKSQHEFTLNFLPYDSDIAKRWVDALKIQCKINNKIKEPDRFYNFPDNVWTEEHIVSEINVCIDKLNLNRKLIDLKVSAPISQLTLNKLHLYFETLRGGILTPSNFWISASEQERTFLERYNVLIHRAESFYHNKNIKSNPRIVCTFINRKRYELLENDYKSFTLERNFGEVYINYCEVGKPLYDVFKDNDDLVTDQNIRPLRYYSADFTISFHDRTSESVNLFLQKMSDWWNLNEEKLSKLGFIKNDPKNAIGNIPVAKLHTNLSNNEIINNLCEYHKLSHIII
jgi:hypothetical protein